MQYSILCIVYLIIIFMKVRGYAVTQRFCGDSLANILSQYCLTYNTPGHRVKRQVIEECCRNYCSLQHLLTNYCATYNSEALRKHLEEKNEIQKDRTIQNENIQQTSLESYLSRRDPYPQVRKNSHTSQTHHSVAHVHNFQWNSSTQHPHEYHERKRRKINRNKNTKRRNVWETTDLAIKIAPEPKLGQMEDSQKPFYVFRHYNR